MNWRSFGKIQLLAFTITAAIFTIMLTILIAGWQAAFGASPGSMLCIGIFAACSLGFCGVAAFVVWKARFSIKESAAAFAGAVLIILVAQIAFKGSIDGLQWAGAIVPALALVLGHLMQTPAHSEIVPR